MRPYPSIPSVLPASSDHVGGGGDTDRPLAPPFAGAERSIEPREVAGQGQHRPNHIFGNSGLVPMDVREGSPIRQRRTIDPIEPGTGHLNQFQAGSGTPHFGGQSHRHQHVDIGELRDDAGLVGNDNLACGGQVTAYRLLEPGRKGAGKCDTQHGRSPVRIGRNCVGRVAALQFLRRE